MTITQAQLNAEINTNLPTTGAGAVTAAIARQTLTDMTTAIFQSANVLNVKSFGVVGNGITDDYLTIKAADAAVASAGGGMLFFPAGTYFSSLAVQPSSGVNYQGAGRDVTIIKGQGVGPAPFNSSLVIAATYTGGNQQNNLTGTAITYPIDPPTEGTNTVKTTTNSNAGNFSAGQFILISGDTHGTNFWYPDWFTTVVSANAGTGVITLAENLPFGGAIITTVQRLLAVPQNIKVSDMTILGTNDESLQVNAGQNIIFDNIAIRAGFGGVSGASPGFSACRNCSFQNSVGYGVIVDFLGCFDIRFINNVLNSGTIQFDGGTQNSFISGNNINDPTDGNGNPFHGINLAIYTRRNRVIGNAIVNVPASLVGINSVGQVTGDGNHVIEGNTITGVDTTTTFGIALNNSVNNTVVGNWLNNLAFGVIVANNATGQMIDANTPIGVTTPYSIDATSSVRQPFVVGPFTIAGLPTCNIGTAGGRATVSNGIASPTYQQVVSTTGTTTQPVFCNGVNWIYD